MEAIQVCGNHRSLRNLLKDTHPAPRLLPRTAPLWNRLACPLPSPYMGPIQRVTAPTVSSGARHTKRSARPERAEGGGSGMWHAVRAARTREELCADHAVWKQSLQKRRRSAAVSKAAAGHTNCWQWHQQGRVRDEGARAKGRRYGEAARVRGRRPARSRWGVAKEGSCARCILEQSYKHSAAAYRPV